MAKLKSLIKIEGTLDELTFYKTQDGNLVRQKGVEILDIVAKQNDELLQKAEEFAGKWVKIEKPKHTDEQKDELILGLIRKNT